MRRGGRRLWSRAAPALLLAGALYIGYHMTYGDRGLLAWLRMDQEVRALRAETAAARSERERLEHRVALLRPDSLDPDLLEERAREVLDLGYRDDRVILLEPEPR
jgi:cell division protein FtsB